MWFFVIILLILVLGCIWGKQDADNRTKVLKELDDNAKAQTISISFASPYGGLAFIDETQIVVNYHRPTSNRTEINYSDIIDYSRHSNLNGVEINVCTAKYPVQSGDVGADHIKALTDKLDAIIKNNRNIAINEYRSLVECPSNAARVNVRSFSGPSTLIPDCIHNWKTTYLWTSNDKVYLFPTFQGLADFRCNPSVYQVIEIEKNYIVQISQEGSIHYTTEVSGGGGGGSSIKGAIIGGAIAGSTGAVIGSRKEIQPIKSTTKQIDDRATKVRILDASNNYCEIIFDYNDYYVISKLMSK